MLVVNEVNLDELVEVMVLSFFVGNFKINVIGEVIKFGIIFIVFNSIIN